MAVATGAVPLAEGTDMGGSVRIPAALCGVVGFKPSLGGFPSIFCPACSTTYRTSGLFVVAVRMLPCLLLRRRARHDCDIQSLPTSFEYDGSLRLDPRPIRLALSLDFGFYAIDPEVERNTLSVVDRLKREGIELKWSN